MSKNGLFGKEIGLIEQVIDTGRRIGAGWGFWESLGSPLLCQELGDFLRDTDLEELVKQHGYLEGMFDEQDSRPEAFYNFSTLCHVVAVAAQNGIGKEEWAKLAHSAVLFRAALRFLHVSHPYGIEFPVPYNSKLLFHPFIRPEEEMLKPARHGIGMVKAAIFPVTAAYAGLRDMESCVMKPYGYQPADAYELSAFARVTLHHARPWAIVGTNHLIATGTTMHRPLHDGDTLHFLCIDPFQGQPALWRGLVLGSAERHQYRESRLNVGDFVLGVQRF